MKKYFLYAMAASLILVAGCQKEFSFETGNTPGSGSLQSEVSGDCLPKTIKGIYEVGKPLVADSNTLTVGVDVIKTGTYLITTDTVNGFYFRGTGIFTSLGINTVTLRSNGTPFTEGIFNFVVSYDSTSCDVQVTVLPAGAGGPAAFTITSSGNPASCSGAVAAGNYIVGSPLNASNTVTLSVNVTTIGTFNVSTTAVNGMTFSGSGVFINTGANSVVLTGSGTPAAPAGAITIPVTAGSSSCNFQVTTVTGAEYSFDCANATVNGTYQAGTALGASNTVTIPVNVTSAGPYNISVTSNGMTFSASGTFTVGATSITLTGSGTPATEGTFTVPLPGTIPCSFDVTVAAGTATIDWQFNVGTTVYKGSTMDAIETSAAGTNILAVQGTQDVGAGAIIITLFNTSGAISTGNYSGTAVLGKSAGFIFGDGVISWTGTSGTGSDLPVNLTVYNKTTHIVQGTFAGKVKDGNGADVMITSGTFKAYLP